MLKEIPVLESLAESVRLAGYTQALLLGMGGSSLAPEVFRKTFGVRPGYLDLAVLDSTDPGAVLGYARELDLAKTLFIVSTKSGGTVETFSFFKFFYNLVADKLGAEQAGAHFIAITDPGSELVKLAEQYHFRATFLNNPQYRRALFGALPFRVGAGRAGGGRPADAAPAGAGHGRLLRQARPGG